MVVILQEAVLVRQRKTGFAFCLKAKAPFWEKPQSVTPLLLANPAKNNCAPPCSQVDKREQG